MAPSATETITVPVQTEDVTKVRLTANSGPYKELAPIGYEKDAELKGKDGHNAAAVCIRHCLQRTSLTHPVPSLPPNMGQESVSATQAF